MASFAVIVGSPAERGKNSNSPLSYACSANRIVFSFAGQDYTIHGGLVSALEWTHTDMDAFRLARKLVGSLTIWNARRIWHLVRTQGPMAVWDRAVYAFGNKDANRYRELEARPRELVRQRKTPLPFQPKISLAVATFNTPLPFLNDLVGSVFAQTYPHWELCIADGASTSQGIVPFLND